MAIQNLNKQDQLDLTMNWDGATGQQVEDLISRHLPASMGYDSSSNVLTIANTNGDTIVQTEVSVAQPIYNHSIQIDGVYFNNTSSESSFFLDNVISNFCIQLNVGLRNTFIATNP